MSRGTFVQSPPRPLALALAVSALLLAGCAGGPRASTTGPPASGAAVAPRALPPDAFPSQRLFRLELESTEGEGALRLVLRLVDAARYRLTIADRLGRPLYTVDAAAGGGLLLDHRERIVCPLEPGVRLEELPIDPLPLAALPAILLGRLPAAPAAPPPSVARGPLDYLDAAGHRWTVTLGVAAPERWTLWRDGEPAVWWRRRGGDSILSDRRRSLQMTWREVGREPLAGNLGPPAAPDDYRPGECRTVAGPGLHLSDTA